MSAKPRRYVTDKALYLTDNGRILCGQHCGTAAAYTGADISGQPIELVTDKHAAEWARLTGEVIHCEDCQRRYSPESDRVMAEWLHAPRAGLACRAGSDGRCCECEVEMNRCALCDGVGYHKETCILATCEDHIPARSDSEYHEATSGALCTQGPDGCCTMCGVEMTLCALCKGVGYHYYLCPLSETADTTGTVFFRTSKPIRCHPPQRRRFVPSTALPEHPTRCLCSGSPPPRMRNHYMDLAALRCRRSPLRQSKPSRRRWTLSSIHRRSWNLRHHLFRSHRRCPLPLSRGIPVRSFKRQGRGARNAWRAGVPPAQS